MARQTIDNGTVAGDGTGEILFNAFEKTNDNFTELYMNNKVRVNSASDFPTAAANVITLAANTVYMVSGSIDIGADRFDTSNGGVVLMGSNPNLDKITTTNTGALFTGTSVWLRELGVTITGGDVFNMSGLGVISCSGFFVFGCEKLGTVNATGLFFWNNSNITNMSISGLTISGACRSIIIQNNSLSNFEGTGIDLGTSTASLIRLDGNRMSGNVGAVSLNVGALSANILDGEGWVTNNLFNGLGTAAIGSTSADDDWVYHDNSGLPNSFRGGDGHILGNGTATTISTISTPVQINFASGFIPDLESSFTVDTDGCFTYTGSTAQNVEASATIYGDSASGTNVGYRFYFAKNDIVAVGSVAQEQYDSSDPHSTAIFHIDQLVNGDKICLWVENITNTTNITIETASIRVVGL
jgi:hypothetical protein